MTPARRCAGYDGAAVICSDASADTQRPGRRADVSVCRLHEHLITTALHCTLVLQDRADAAANSLQAQQQQ